MNPTSLDWPHYEIYHRQSIDPCRHQGRDFQGRELEREVGGGHLCSPLLERGQLPDFLDVVRYVMFANLKFPFLSEKLCDRVGAVSLVPESSRYFYLAGVHSAGSGTDRASSIFWSVSSVIDFPACKRDRSFPSLTAFLPKVDVEMSCILQCLSIRSIILVIVSMFFVYGLFPILSTGYFPRAISHILGDQRVYG